MQDTTAKGFEPVDLGPIQLPVSPGSIAGAMLLAFAALAVLIASTGKTRGRGRRHPRKSRSHW